MDFYKSFNFDKLNVGKNAFVQLLKQSLSEQTDDVKSE